MKILKMNPTSPGVRFVSKIKKHKDVYKGCSYSKLTLSKKNISGRNAHGKITVRHRGGGHKRHYRIIDFKRNNFGIEGTVNRLEYDPNRNAYIAFIVYNNGDKRYIIAPKDLSVGNKIISGNNVDVRIGNCMVIINIPSGTIIHNIEINPGKGAQLARSAGSFAQIISKDEKYAVVRLKSNEIRKILLTCTAVIGMVSNVEHNLKSLGKAGAKRWRGIRPTVRGVAMNPVDHPHGGGEGKTSGGRHPVSFSGVLAKGYKTRKKNKYSDKFIIKNRR